VNIAPDRQDINRTYYREHRDHIRARQIMLHNERRDSDLCIKCGAAILDKEFIQCERCREAIRQRHQRLKAEVIIQYGGRCACCGESDVHFLAIDHINGGGNVHRKQTGIGTGAYFYKWLRKHKYPKGYRVLCFNCNFSLGAYGMCPHQELKQLITSVPEHEAIQYEHRS